MMRPLLLLVSLLMVAFAALLVAFSTTPDINTVLAGAFGGLAVYIAAELLGDRFP